MSDVYSMNLKKLLTSEFSIFYLVEENVETSQQVVSNEGTRNGNGS